MPFIGPAITLVFYIFQFFMQLRGLKKEDMKILTDLAQGLRRQGIANVKSRYEAEEQIEEIEELWENRHKAKEAEKAQTDNKQETPPLK